MDINNFENLVETIIFEEINHEVIVDERGEFDFFDTDDLSIVVDKSD